MIRGEMNGPRLQTCSALRLASPTTAAILGVLSLVLLFAAIPFDVVLPGAVSPTGSGVVSNLTWWVFGLSFTAVGVVVARREPRNPMGWLLVGTVLAIQLGADAEAYAYLTYRTSHAGLPLGHVAVLFSAAWTYGFPLLPLIILLFPDGRLGLRWRWPLRAYLSLFGAVIAGAAILAVEDFHLRVPVDGSGTLIGINHQSAADAWFGLLGAAALLSVGLLAIAGLVYQLRRFRRASGDRRQQLKWLGAGAATGICLLVPALLWSNAPAIVGELLFTLGISALPIAIGMGILRYRLYEIDRLVSRTLSYAILTALLAGTFVGLIALTTNVLDISGRVGVATSTLAAAALFNPLRRRIQDLVDRRFNRARYDSEEIIAAFNHRLRDAVEIDAVRADLLDTVTRAVQPTHASVWIKP
jgi:hypothetical protein